MNLDFLNGLRVVEGSAFSAASQAGMNLAHFGARGGVAGPQRDPLAGAAMAASL